MTVDSAACRPAQAPSVSCERSKPSEVKEPMEQGVASRTASQRSLDYFSEGLKTFAPIEGLRRSDDIQGEVPDAGTLKVTTIAPCVQKFIQARENASRGVIDNSFFAADFSSIQKKAEALVQGEAYDPGDVENRFFVRSLCDFFVGSDEKEVAASYEALVREYADKLKNGETPDITQFQTKFSLSGEETTIGQVLNMRNTALAIRDVDYGSGVGTDMFISFARKGMMRAAAETYASTLPEGLGKVFSSRMTQLVDKNTTASMQQWKNLAYCNGQISKDFNQFLTQSAEYAFSLFSKSNLTSADLADKTAELTRYISDSGYFQPESEQVFRNILSKSCREVISSIS